MSGSELTKLQQDAVDRIYDTWIERHGQHPNLMPKVVLARIIKEADLRGDMTKPVILMTAGKPKTYAVPIEHIILNGLKGGDVSRFPEISKQN